MNTRLKRSSFHPGSRPSPHLPDDLLGREVAEQAHEAGRAERAAQGAADLARKAQREATLGSHRDTFDLGAVAERDHELVGVAVLAVVRRMNVRRRQIAPRRQLITKRSREVRHVLGGAMALAIDPREELLRAIGGVPMFGKLCRESRPTHAVEARRTRGKDRKARFMGRPGDAREARRRDTSKGNGLRSTTAK